MKNNTLLRQESIKKVFSVIREKGPISKRQLEDITKFSWGNISSIISLLSAKGYLMINGKQNTGVGRKPESFDVNNNNNFIVGVDFNVIGVTVVLCDLSGKIVWETELFFNKLEKDYMLEVLYSAVNKAFEYAKDKNILSIAVAMQGEVDTKNGISLCIDKVKDWNNVAVADILKEKYNVPAIVLHDPDCLLYSEKFFGAINNTNTENAVLIRIDHGAGIGVMCRGEILMSRKGETCEIGGMVIPFGKEGKQVKNILSTISVCDTYNALSSKKLTFEQIAHLAYAKEKTAQAVFEEVGAALAYTVNNVSVLLNPEKVILFGTLAQYNDLYIETVNNILSRLMQNPVPIVISKLKRNASAVGATIFAADYFVQNADF